MRKLFLIAILILAAFLRLWNLVSVPPSVSMDEASIGYNAYSVLKIGVDEYGNFPLISQRGYDDWRRSTYLFLVAPFVALFDLQVISIRLPAVILSILTVWATYYITLSLFSKRWELSWKVALLASLLLAISPWHIYISRLGHEANAYLFFFILGLLCFLQAKKNTSRSWFAMLFFILSMISYYAGQVFLPVFGMGVAFIYRKSLMSKIVSDKKFRVFLIICVLVLIPVLWNLFSPAAMVRFRGTSTFTPQAHVAQYSKRVELRNKEVENHDIVGTIVYNRHLYPFHVLFEGYISHFNPKWLFANSSAEPFKVPNMGLLYMWEFPFIIIGMLAFLLSRDVNARTKQLLFLWFFLAPLPASIATQAPHAMRSYLFLPTWQLFTAFGVVYAVSKLKKFKTVGVVVVAFFIVAGVMTFYKNYYTVFPKEQSSSFHYALSKAIPYVLSKQNNFDKVIFSNEDNLYQSYMLFLYFSQYDPSLYQKQGGTKSGGFAEMHNIGTVEFRPIHWAKDQSLKNTLFLANPGEIPSNVSTLEYFNYLDGKPGVVAFKNY